jgi:penicillin-binding protein 1C
MLQRRQLKLVAALAAGIPVAAAAIPAAAIEGAYYVYLFKLDLVPEVPPLVQLGDRLSRAVWLSVEDGQYEVEPQYPWTMPLHFALNRTRPSGPPGNSAASSIAKQWLHEHGQSRRGLGRHGREWTLIVWLSRRWTAAEMTQGLADTLYFGRGTYGLHAASFRFFGKNVRSLEPQELALLMALPQSPVRLSPYVRPDEALRARNRMLERFVAAGLISAEELVAAKRMPIEVRPLSPSPD